MADISTFLKNILSARYGKDVRQSIHDAIDAVNTSAEGSAASARKYAENAYEDMERAAEYASVASEYKGEAYSYKEEAETSATNAATSEQNALLYAAEAQKTVDVSNKTVAFTEAETRENIASGETVATIFGKVMKYFADIRPFAFNPMVNDLLSTTPYRALDSRQGKVLAQMISDATTPVDITDSVTIDAYTIASGDITVQQIGKLVVIDLKNVVLSDNVEDEPTREVLIEALPKGVTEPISTISDVKDNAAFLILTNNTGTASTAYLDIWSGFGSGNTSKYLNKGVAYNGQITYIAE